MKRSHHPLTERDLRLLEALDYVEKIEDKLKHTDEDPQAAPSTPKHRERAQWTGPRLPS